MERNSLGRPGRSARSSDILREDALVSATKYSHDISAASASMSVTTHGSSLPDRLLDDAAGNKPTLLSIPQELRNKIFGYLYNITGPVAKAIDLDVSSIRRRWLPGTCELTGYFYYLPIEVHPPTKTPLLICKQLHAEMSRMHGAAFRNYWTANTFTVELCNQSFGGSDHIEEEHLRHIHHIAYNSKSRRGHLTLHFVFKESWSLVVEVADCIYPEDRMAPLSDLQGYCQFDKLEEVSRLPTKLEQRYRKTKVPLDPSIGEGFTCDELVAFLGALDVLDSFDDLEGFCVMASLRKMPNPFRDL